MTPSASKRRCTKCSSSAGLTRSTSAKSTFFASPREVRDALTPAVLDHYKVNLLEFIEYPEAEEFRLSQGAAA